MSFWESLRIGASGLAAQRLRLDIIANNVANAETTRTTAGGAYQRQDVVFTPANQHAFLPAFLNASHRVSAPTGGVQVSQVVTSQEAGPRVYDPTHPDADEAGYVTYPNVNLVTEMTNMISATRSYEANLTVIDAAKRMALKALDIGR